MGAMCPILTELQGLLRLVTGGGRLIEVDNAMRRPHFGDKDSGC